MRRSVLGALALFATACGGAPGQTDGRCGNLADGTAVPPGAYRCISNKVEICIVADKVSDPPVWQIVQDCTAATGVGVGPAGACVMGASGAASCVR